MKKKFRNHYIDRYYKFIYKTNTWEKRQLNNGYLYYYGNRNYPTKITKEDLPESFMWYWDGNTYHFLNSAGIVDIVYQPVINNHVFRDDYLCISYTDKIKYNNKYAERDERFTNWLNIEDEWKYEKIWGGEIIEFLLFAEKYSNYNIEPIKEQMWNKMLILEKYEPELFKSQIRSREDFDGWFNEERFKFKYE